MVAFCCVSQDRVEPVSHLLVTDKMVEYVQSLHNFLVRSGATIPPAMTKVLEGMREVSRTRTLPVSFRHGISHLPCLSFVSLHVHAHIHTHTHMLTCLYTHARTHARTHAHTHTHTHTHTYIHTLVLLSPSLSLSLF